ncbi:arsenate reductase [Muriicola jejuensis]|uniref:Arsenate reductase n=1 Tax=Muriicola jejuensis TaxID=504488 RepID=A0A6P0UIZ8_9FLAO|nr:ArsC/Spx/MgsR family protein [Muriicola jejuensis]NER10176.1 hypothetical protein [Muriicola jejuensis]SMP02507.1 arsenate reductase [Muriicola jejuensis]
MKDTFFYLSTCDTCQRILGELDLPEDVRLQDIKSEPLNSDQVEALMKLAGSFEALFSKRARLYKERNLKAKNLAESDFRDLLLEHYTFLKRPVLVHNGQIFIGNAKNTVALARQSLHP